ncbi:hypothetical protein KSP39_PZI003482 [Platanthera zijinensis]|uniref:Uncharacterized protein n=1 Tax=Platanthera zijinensis TaxID=2320716 RepID=A0AAP0BUH5_9ASPA
MEKMALKDLLLDQQLRLTISLDLRRFIFRGSGCTFQRRRARDLFDELRGSGFILLQQGGAYSTHEQGERGGVVGHLSRDAPNSSSIRGFFGPSPMGGFGPVGTTRMASSKELEIFLASCRRTRMAEVAAGEGLVFLPLLEDLEP